jgi:hypothetical protein
MHEQTDHTRRESGQLTWNELRRWLLSLLALAEHLLDVLRVLVDVLAVDPRLVALVAKWLLPLVAFDRHSGAVVVDLEQHVRDRAEVVPIDLQVRPKRV